VYEVVFFQIAASLGHIDGSIKQIPHGQGTWLVRLRARVPEEGLEVSTGQKLQDYEPWVFLKADPDELDDVCMLELAHDESLHQEVHLRLIG